MPLDFCNFTSISGSVVPVVDYYGDWQTICLTVIAFCQVMMFMLTLYKIYRSGWLAHD